MQNKGQGKLSRSFILRDHTWSIVPEACTAYHQPHSPNLPPSDYYNEAMKIWLATQRLDTDPHLNPVVALSSGRFIQR